MFCIRCGKRNPEDASFCKQCGAPMASPEDEMQPLAAPHSADGATADAATPLEPQTGVVADAPAEPPTMAAVYAKIASGDCAAARADLAAITAADPANRDAHALLSTLLEQAGDLDAAITAREKVVELAPDSAIDRDKLAALRAAAASLRHPPQRTGLASLFESPAGAAAAGVAVTLLVLVIGGGIAWNRADRTQQKVAPPLPPDVPAAVNQPPATPRVLVNPGVMVNPQSNAGTQTPGAPQSNGSQASASGPARNGDTTGMSPARVVSQPAPPIESDPRYAERSRADASGTVHLPDRDTSGARPADAAASNNAVPTQDPGHIEIIVSNPVNNAKTTAPKDANSAAQASQSQRAYGQQQQVLGNYTEAIAAYRRALDGAGDDAPAVQQQLALCYQHLGDRKGATAAYKEMIAGYNAQISAGRNVDAAKQGIKAAQLGLKGIQ